MTNLEDEVFRIVERIPYVTKRLSVGVSYRCVGVRNGHTQVFDENSLAPTTREQVTSDRHAPLDF
jgi:hypothetical protein